MCDQQDDHKEIVTCKVEDLPADYRELEEQHKNLGAAFEGPRNQFESEISKHTHAMDAYDKLKDQITKKEIANTELKQEIKIILNNCEATESNSKKYIKTIKEREKKLYDLKKEHTKEKEDLESIRQDTSE
jgi:chromosome segregation ATPase